MAVRGVSKVVVPVRDQQRALEFWTEVVGFTATTDVPYDDRGTRWIEVTAPNGTSTFVLSASESDREAFREVDGVLTAPFFLYADDVERTHAELSAAGVVFPDPPSRQPWGWWSSFLDSEGNRFVLQQG
ncbi:VOC family protein [Saccharopolyspora griseoalba]|uniref:VOC family protein n=1 Tax=Saccharopolyspora griseoalba TaxID=1431848 RepID=A0ABW2LRW3_9PSEU